MYTRPTARKRMRLGHRLSSFNIYLYTVDENNAPCARLRRCSGRNARKYDVSVQKKHGRRGLRSAVHDEPRSTSRSDRPARKKMAFERNECHAIRFAFGPVRERFTRRVGVLGRSYVSAENPEHCRHFTYCARDPNVRHDLTNTTIFSNNIKHRRPFVVRNLSL